MKRRVAIGIILIIFGGGYFWWWNQAANQLSMASIRGSSHAAQNWEELRDEYPQLHDAFRLLKVDPFVRHENNAGQRTNEQFQKFGISVNRHALGGLLVAGLGVVVPVIGAVRQRRPKR